MGAFAEQPYGEDRAENLKSFPARVRRCAAEEPDFRLLVAFESSALVGFVLGTGIGVGDWWRDRVAEVLDPQHITQWLRDESFCVAELAVAPTHRRGGVAQSLMDAVLVDLPYETAILGCYGDAVSARTFYSNTGWQLLASDLRISHSPELCLFGRNLA